MPPREPAPVLPFPRGAPALKRPRDPRIDAFRGLALVMIFVDHMPGNPYEDFTIRNIGFSDAAEAFFVMSGIAAALAYAGRFTPEARAKPGGGFWPAMRPMWKRAWVLYLSHLFLTLWAIAIFALGIKLLGLTELLVAINLGPVFTAPLEALIGIPLLGHQLGYVNILPAYAVLLLVAPLAILVGLRRPWLLAAASAALWLAAGIWRLNLPNYPNPGGWFFNPLAWQAVFVTGLLIGLALRRDARLVPVNRGLMALALGYLALAFVWRHVPGAGEALNHQMWRLGQLGAPFNVISHDKTFLALPRLLHILALVYLVSCLPVVTRASAHPLAAPLRLMGRQGLLVFSAGTLLSLGCQVLMAYADPAALWPALLPAPLGVVAMLAVAWIAERQKQPAPVTPAPAATPPLAPQLTPPVPVAPRPARPAQNAPRD